jgi:predicted Zn-dependent peptidase
MKILAMYIALALFFLESPALSAQEAAARSPYTPPGLYDVEQLQLANGFRVILKQRSGTRNVSLRLAVNIGTRHFDCSRRETPHLIEHLLFSGTARHTEAQLDRLIEEHGGSWNATTGGRYTTYEADIFDRYAGLALDTLYEIMTETAFTGKKVRIAKDVVARENGGRPTILRRLLYRYGIGKTAWNKANEWLLPGTGAVCPGLPDLGGTGEEELTATFKEAYVPGNMILIVVGNFDREALLEQLRRTFGSLAPAPVPQLPVSTPPYPAGGPVRVRGTLAPFLSSTGYVGVAYRTAGLASSDIPALSVLCSYLDKKLYEELRIRNGLSYGPEVSEYLRPDYGLLYISADVGIKNADRVNKLVHDTLRRIGRTPPDRDEVEGVKRTLLLRWAQGYETNTGTADFYVENLAELEQRGGFRSYAGGIERVTAADVSRVAATYLRTENRVDVLGVPTLTYTQFFLLVGAILLLSFMVVAIVLWKRSRSRRRMAPSYIRKL